MGGHGGHAAGVGCVGDAGHDGHHFGDLLLQVFDLLVLLQDLTFVKKNKKLQKYLTLQTHVIVGACRHCVIIQAACVETYTA